MVLYIIRHGETEENRKRICQGQTDGILTPKGISEAHQVGHRLSDTAIDVCYSSDLGRARDTAQIIVDEHGTQIPLVLDKRLRERYFGSYQGQVFPTTPDDFFYSEAEAPHDIAFRLSSFLQYLKSNHPHDNVLIVSHGFTLRILLALFSGLGADEWGQIPELLNASLSIVEGIDPYTIRSINDVSHFSGEKQ